MFQMERRDGRETGARSRIITMPQRNIKVFLGNICIKRDLRTITARMAKEAARLIFRILITSPIEEFLFFLLLHYYSSTGLSMGRMRRALPQKKMNLLY